MELPKNGPVRLNIGAGNKRIPGWIGIDAVERPGADLVCDAQNIPMPNGSVDEIMAIHVIEHFYRWEVPVVLKEWHRLLKKGGHLILEQPDLLKCCQNVIDNTLKGGKALEQLGMWGCYGDPRDSDPFMNHKWGWTFQTLSAECGASGFSGMRQCTTQFHPAGRQHRDFRLEARKQ